jgi:hypothetical protein
LKHYYFNNTNHGGAAGNGGKNINGLYTNGVISGDHCRPLMRLCQRSIMWKLGMGQHYFEENALKESIIPLDGEITEELNDDVEVTQHSTLGFQFGEL